MGPSLMDHVKNWDFIGKPHLKQGGTQSHMELKNIACITA